MRSLPAPSSVLALLFGQPERSFFTKELIDLAGGCSGAVQRELARLQSSGLIVQTVLGNRKHYRANAKAPIFAELCGVAAKMLGPVDTLRRALAPVADSLSRFWVHSSRFSGGIRGRTRRSILRVVRLPRPR